MTLMSPDNGSSQVALYWATHSSETRTITNHLAKRTLFNDPAHFHQDSTFIQLAQVSNPLGYSLTP